MIASPSPLAIAHVPLDCVRLLSGPVLERQELNLLYLLELDPDRLLHTFRLQAGLPSSAEPLGGWEAPKCGLRGHFVGHYLSACAQGYASTGRQALLERLTRLVDELAKCQQPNGYLSAFPETELDTIETRFEGAWAPYYTLHKILAGLLDAYEYGRLEQALFSARSLADYLAQRIARLSPEQLDEMCHTDRKPNPSNEYGGIGEALRRLGQMTGEKRYEVAARQFDRDWFVRPLLARDDRLAGLHANTHIPMVLSLARRYEMDGDTALGHAVVWFWERTALARSYVNGGSSGPHPDGIEKSKGAEHWPEAFCLADTLTPKINESCVTHNMLRLTATLFQWTADPRYAEFHERAYLNHVLAMQCPDRTGGYLYDHPLGACSHKAYGTPHDSFWCCYGTTTEAYARLNSGIYFCSDAAVWVNLYVASEFAWGARAVTIRQETQFPEESGTHLSVCCDQPSKFQLRLRIPSWTKRVHASINGEQLPVPDGEYLVVDREWQDGDVVDLGFDMVLSVETMPDDPTLVAFRHGPLVLAALAEGDLVLPARDAEGALASLGISSPQTFHTTLADGRTVPLVPVNQVTTETFGVYFRLEAS